MIEKPDDFSTREIEDAIRLYREIRDRFRMKRVEIDVQLTEKGWNIWFEDEEEDNQ